MISWTVSTQTTKKKPLDSLSIVEG